MGQSIVFSIQRVAFRISARFWGAKGPPRLDKDFHHPIDHNAETFLLFEVKSFTSDQFPGLHTSSQLVEDRTLEITEYLDSAQELVQVA
ncbi:hypothetical protein HYQ46_006982 [Verticillium longisporum]|nr:hypothetical protein HYQ46_006982 [Verticillium longisporum]